MPPPAPAISAALFDLDGTLADTAPQLHAAAQSALADVGMPPVPFDEARGFIGDGMPRFIKRLLTRQWWGEPPPPLFEKARARLAHHYAECCTRSATYPHVPAVLAQLAARPIGMACVTNKAERFATPLLQASGIAEYFSHTICGDTLPVKKPDPAPLHAAIERLGATAATTVMVGDSLADSRAAAAAGCKFICMKYGYHLHHPPPADAHATTFDELPELIDSVFTT